MDLFKVRNADFNARCSVKDKHKSNYREGIVRLVGCNSSISLLQNFLRYLYQYLHGWNHSVQSFKIKLKVLN